MYSPMTAMETKFAAPNKTTARIMLVQPGTSVREEDILHACEYQIAEKNDREVIGQTQRHAAKGNDGVGCEIEHQRPIDRPAVEVLLVIGERLMFIETRDYYAEMGFFRPIVRTISHVIRTSAALLFRICMA